MAGNVVHLPRPTAARPKRDIFALYLRPGHSQHKELLNALAAGKRDFSGVVIEAGNIDRHHELIAHAHQVGMDIVLDPKTQAMATPGGHSNGMAKLPWGSEKPHGIDDFTGDAGRKKSHLIAQHAADHNFTQILGPTHLLGSANDWWLRRDVQNMAHLRNALDEDRSAIQLIYPLMLSMQVLRDPLQRAAIIAAVADAPADSIWLRVDNFGSDASGEKTVAYIEAVRDFHALGKPVIADHVGGLAGSGLLSFGAVGGIAQGITMQESFKANRWQHPRREGQSGGMATRVYMPHIDLFLSPPDAEAFIGSSTRTRTRFGCRDTHCCPGGLRDMLENPAKHFVHQRSEEIRTISERPETVRVAEYVDRMVRPVSDNVAQAVGLGAISSELRKKLEKKQKTMGAFREAIAHFAEVDAMPSRASAPPSRSERSGKP